MSFQVKFSNKKITQLKKLCEDLNTEIVDKETAKKIGESVVEKILSFISKGFSPINGVGRFPAYKGASAVSSLKSSKLKTKGITPGELATARAVNKGLNKGIKKIKQNSYPFNVIYKYPDKKLRPVNLSLSGDMQNSLIFEIERGKNGYRTEIFYAYGEDVKEQGHRHGVNGQPKRPSLPTVKGEEFILSIQRIYINIFKERINQLLKIAGLKS